ncbi:hypothetical protein ACIB24_13520 [Spongisporangium articulatum]|uniref:Uncharacterized protein n=1 Tax=Spongisporangium articulatum TaxID=3362603 RepID=A0ABW8AQ69_9ACTN
MSRSSIGRTAAVCLTAIVAGACLSVPGTASAAPPTVRATAGTIGSATVVDIGVDSAPSMVLVGSRLFVAAGDQIRVLSGTGRPVATITGQAGVSDLALAADGTLYAALKNASAISIIDPVGLKETARISSLPCVSQLAVNSTSLFAGQGCDQNQATVTVIDRSTASVTQSLERTWYRPPLLAANESRLVALGQGVTPATLATYSLSGGTATETAAARTELVNAVALSPDGRRIAGAEMSPYGLAELDADTLQQTAFYTTGPYPTGAAYSADGTKLVGTLQAGSDWNMVVFATADGSTLTRRRVVIPGESSVDMTPGTAVFDAAAGHVYAIASNGSPFDPTARLAIIATREPLPSSVRVKAGSHAFGKAVPVSVTGRAGAKVTLAVDDGGARSTKSLTLGSSGTGTTSVRADHGGSVTATLPGDADYAPATSTAKIISASRTSIGLSGFYKTSKGVRYFHSYKDVEFTLRVKPAGFFTVTLKGQMKSGGKWRTYQTLALNTDSRGFAYAHLLRGSKNVPTRVSVKFSGAGNLKGSSSGWATYRIT